MMTIVQLLTLWMFVLLVGGHASVMRAAVMLTMYAISQSMGNRVKSVDALTATALLLLLACPQWLFDVSFQMSFMVMLSIVLFFSPLMAYARGKREKESKIPRYVVIRRRLWNGFWAVMILTFVAQIGVLPLMMHYFGRVSVYFFLTNLIMSPGVYLVILLAMGVLMHLPLAGVLAVVVRLMNGALEWITNLPCSSIVVTKPSAWQTILLYVILWSATALLIVLIRRTDRYEATTT